MLELVNIHKTFNLGTINEKKALDGVNLRLDEGDFVTVIGGNGAGKSTVLNAIAGVWPIDTGNIIIDGQDVTGLPEHKRAAFLGRVFQDPMKGTAPNMTIEENLALAYTRASKQSPFSRAITKKKIQFFRENLARYNMGIEDRMKTKIGLLSGGQRQVVTLLMCTLSIPKLLLLDEHTAALDPATAEKVMDITKTIVQENNITTMMITHNLKQSLTTGTRTIMLDSGEIILDLSGEERKNTTMEDMIKMYSIKKQKEFDNDRILLSQ